MKITINRAFTFLIAIIIIQCFSEKIIAQNNVRDEAVNLYNTAQEFAENGEYSEAIPLYLRAFDISRSNELNQISQRLEEQIPKVYFSRASSAFRSYQNENTIENISAAIEYFEETKTVAQNFDSQQVFKISKRTIPQLYYKRAVLYVEKNEYDNSISDLNKAIELYPNYADAYHKKGEIYKELYPNDLEDALSYFNLALDNARNIGDTETRNKAQLAIDNINSNSETNNEGWEIISEFTGTGSENTAPFSISSDEWKIQYRSLQTGDFGHSFILRLRKPGGTFDDLIVNEANQSIISGETYFYEAGRFYIDSSSSGGEWRVIILIPKSN